MKLEMGENWFENEEFWVRYRPLMFDPDRMADTSLDADGIIALTGVTGGRVLDACCGEGRHAIEFAGRGYDVTGVDTCRKYMEKAKADAAGLGAGVEFIESDVREYIKDDYYDLAFNYFTSFGYFEDEEDDLLFCRNIYKSLKKGGVFLIDTVGKETAALRFREREWFQRDGYLIMLEYKISDCWTHIENRWLFMGDSHNPEDRLCEAVFRHRLYSGCEMGRLLSEAGFSEVRIYGALDGRPIRSQGGQNAGSGKKVGL